MIIRSTSRKYVQESNTQVSLNAMHRHLTPSAHAYSQRLSQSPFLPMLLTQTRPWSQPAAVQPLTHPSAIRLSCHPCHPCQYPLSSAASSQPPLSSQQQRQPPALYHQLALARVPSVSLLPGLDGSTRRRYRGGPAWRLASDPRGVGAGCVRSETGCGSRDQEECLQMQQ